MRSSERWGLIVAGALLLSSTLAIAELRPRLFDSYQRIKQRDDVYLLPSTTLTRLMSLGYRAAFADLIFANVLVSSGQHFAEKRRFEFVANYLETLADLDPSFREPYRLADTLITLQSVPARVQDYRDARRIQEAGLKAFPYDSELWLIAGQFQVYLAAHHLPASERPEWQLDGAKKLARACELVGSNENIPHNCVSAAALLNEAGSRDAMQSFLERVLAVSDDPDIQTLAVTYLGRVLGQAERDRAAERGRQLQGLWSRDLPFISREMLLLLGPTFDPARCAGVPPPSDPACATSFRAWGEMLGRE
jgi:hypothetical protein